MRVARSRCLSLAAGLAPGAGDREGRGFVVGLVVGSTFGLVIGLVLGLVGVWLTPIASSPSASAIGSYRVTGSASWCYVAECGDEYASARFDGGVSAG